MQQQGVMSTYQLTAHDHSGVGQGGLVDPTVINHDALLNFVGAEHLSLPNTNANVLTDHNKIAHDALLIDADTVDTWHQNQGLLTTQTPTFKALKVTGNGPVHPSLYLYEGITHRATLHYDRTNHYILLSALGENADIFLLPNGTGKVRFGAHVGLGGETVTGYINIKDSAGNARKLAVVS